MTKEKKIKTPKESKVQKSHTFSLSQKGEEYDFAVRTIYSDGYRPGVTHFYLSPKEVEDLQTAFGLKVLEELPVVEKPLESTPTGLEDRVARLESIQNTDVTGTLVAYGQVLDAHKEELKMLSNYAKSLGVSFDTAMLSFKSATIERNELVDKNIAAILDAMKEEFKGIHEEVDWFTKTAEEIKFAVPKVNELHDRVNDLGQRVVGLDNELRICEDGLTSLCKRVEEVANESSVTAQVMKVLAAWKDRVQGN
jgi:uncharacterized protein YoxC